MRGCNCSGLTKRGTGLDFAITSLRKLARSSMAKPLPDPAQSPLISMARRSDAGRGTCVLTHDVDWAACYEALDWLCDLEEAHGVVSTFNFLTEWHYPPEPARLAEMQRRGFEIGLHGRLHDAGLGYRPREVVLEELKRALEMLPPSITAYRAPTLCISATLLSVLAEEASRSIPACWWSTATGRASESIWPYRIARGVIEIPLTIQDDLLFREMRLSDGDALKLVVNHLRTVLSAGGVFVFNGHLGILRGHEAFYRGLLEAVVASGCRIMTITKAASTALARGEQGASHPAGRA